MTNRFERARDLRQLRFMLSAIRAFQDGASEETRLLEDLDELVLMLSDDNPRWKQSFLDARHGFARNSKKACREMTRLLESEIKRRERESTDG